VLLIHPLRGKLDSPANGLKSQIFITAGERSVTCGAERRTEKNRDEAPQVVDAVGMKIKPIRAKLTVASSEELGEVLAMHS
jgi:hypothetical protein